ncbi:Ubiquitin carboxyl-terminal hydrolase 37 [Merluccius polli]|uniref:Ubiquitin carboxyl-terminal hydrolase 37 n=1 Tax=Merluccius polli TaxID=89951 RepID=A0AA47NT80_MERPO|nr:Ubiquitin carboxyl-terminal hydrolase 37 [Merluccius polli]
MNAALQSLLTLTSFMQDFQRQCGIWRSIHRGHLIRDFVSVGESRTCSTNEIKWTVLASFKRRVAIHAPQFKNNLANDAFQFLLHTLQHLQSLSGTMQQTAAALGRTYTCPVQTQFSFSLRLTRSCARYAEVSDSGRFTSSSPVLTRADKLSISSRAIVTQLNRHCQCGCKLSEQWSMMTPPSVLFLHLRRIGLTPIGTLVKREDPVVLCRELDLVPGYQDATAVSIYLDYSSILTVKLEIDIRSTIHPSTSQSKGILNCFILVHFIQSKDQTVTVV